MDVFFLISKEQERRDDTGVSEINSLEKDVVEAYQKTIKYSLKPEHRFLLMIVGGHGCGKTNLKYALTGEFHLQKDHETPPTQGIDADPSVCRIKTKQYKDWISEPSPNANRNLAVQRVKLEYTDLVIRQMLNELKSKKCLVQKKKFAISDFAGARASIEMELVENIVEMRDSQYTRVSSVSVTPPESLIPLYSWNILSAL